MSQLLASEPQSVSGVLDQGFRLFRAGFPRTIGLTVLCAVLLLVSQGAEFVGGLADVPGEPLDFEVPGWFGGVAVGIVILVNIAYFAIANAIWHRLWTAAHGAGSTGDSLRVGARRLLPAFGATLLFALLIALSALPAAGAFAVLWPERVALAIAAALVLGTLVMYVFTRLAFGMLEVVVRPAGPVEALRRSWALTAGNFWRVSGVGVVITVIAGVFYLAVAAVAGVLGFALAATPVGIALVALVVLSALMVFVLPYTMAAWVAVWHDLRLRAEGTDLAARIDALPAA